MMKGSARAQINFRCSVEEREEIVRRAKRANLPVGRYVIERSTRGQESASGLRGALLPHAAKAQAGMARYVRDNHVTDAGLLSAWGEIRSMYFEILGMDPTPGGDEG